MEIKQGKTEDIKDIAKLLVDTWQRSYRDIFPQSFLDDLDVENQFHRHCRYMAGPGVTYLVLRDKDDFVGFISFGPPRSIKMKGEVEIYALYVDTINQKRGFGTMLLSEMLSKSNTSIINVEVFQDNPYFAFYTKHGFIPFDEGYVDIRGYEAKFWICTLDRS